MQSHPFFIISFRENRLLFRRATDKAGETFADCRGGAGENGRDGREGRTEGLERDIPASAAGESVRTLSETGLRHISYTEGQESIHSSLDSGFSHYSRYLQSGKGSGQ